VTQRSKRSTGALLFGDWPGTALSSAFVLVGCPGGPRCTANFGGSVIPTGDPALAKSISDDLIAIARGLSPLHGSASGKVARRLGVDILRGHLKRGDKLPSEQGLLARFGVLRTVLREAVKILSAKGFLQAKTRVGTAVRDRENWNFFDAEVLAWRISAGLDADLLQTLREA